MSTHYVAQLKIERVDRTEPAQRQIHQVPPEPKREVSEVTLLTVKATTLDALTEKLGKHIAIIEED